MNNEQIHLNAWSSVRRISLQIMEVKGLKVCDAAIGKIRCSLQLRNEGFISYHYLKVNVSRARKTVFPCYP